ncbi:MAG: LysE/ArgO family amino acid transporter [Planktomarina sp.]
MSPALIGFATGFSLILAIGAQNAFLLRAGLARTHVFPLCLFAATSDAILIVVGVAGFSSINAYIPWFPTVMMWGGAIFLFAYGASRFLAAWRGSYEMVLSGQTPGLWPSLAVLAAFTWANPHVYLDTLGLIGAISLQHPLPSDKLIFGAGAVTASFVFFFGLGYGARFLAPVMTSAKSWQVFDVMIAVVMWALALKLIW